MRAEEGEAAAGPDAVPIDTGFFAAGTAVRFALLLAFVTVDSLTLLSTTLVQLREGDEWYTWFQLCRLAVGYDPTEPYIPAAMMTRAAFVASCDAAHGVRSHSDPVTVISALAVVFALAAALFVLGPMWRRRRGRLLPVDPESSDELARQLRDLVQRADLRRTPAFAIDPRADSVGAVVFGRMGRYTVCLDAGLVARGSAEPAVLRDVVLHELAHIRNRDVDITYATVALWRAFLICALLPNIVGQAVSLFQHPDIWRSQWELGLRGLIRVVVLIALTYLVRADILRTREVYADIDAARLAGDTAFTWRDRPGARRPKLPARHRLLGLMRTHPDWSDRSRWRNDPGILFGATALPMFLTGVTAQVANVQATIWSSPGTTAEVATWTTAVLVVGIAGYILWRAVGYAVLIDRPVPSGWIAGVWLGAGLAVGELLSFRTAGVRLLPPDPEILIVLLISAPVFTSWVTQCAEIWIRGSRGRSLRLVRILGLAAALIVFGTWYGYWMNGLFLLQRGALRSPDLSLPGTPGWFWVVADLGNRPLVLVGASVLWLFPLLAVVRRWNTFPPAWVRRARTDASDAGAVVHRAVPVRHAAAGAVVGGGLCWLTVVVIMARLHPDQPPFGQLPDEWVFRYPMWLSAGLGCVLMLTAIGVSATAARFRLLMGLAAAGGAGLVGLAGLFVLAATDGCIAPMRVMAHTCRWRPGPAWMVVTLQVPFVLGLAIYLAAVAALLGAAVAVAGRRLAGRARATAPRFDMEPELPRSAVVRGVVVVLAAGAVIALVANTAISFYDRGHVEGAAVGTLGREPQPTPEARARRIDAWLRVGGAAEANRLHDDNERLRAATAAAVRAAEGQPTVAVDPEIFAPLCAAIAADADRAAAFVPIPDDLAQADWATWLAVVKRAGDDCRRSFDDKNDALFDRSMTEYVAADAAYATLLRHFDEIRDAAAGG